VASFWPLLFASVLPTGLFGEQYICARGPGEFAPLDNGIATALA